MTIDDKIAEHKALGQILVANWGQEVGEKYSYNWNEHKVVEVCDGELKGFCWIEKFNPKMVGTK